MTTETDTSERRRYIDHNLCAGHAGHEKRLVSVEQTAATIKEALTTSSNKLDLILAQVQKVAILEERHTAQASALIQTHTKLQTIQDKHDDLATEVRSFISKVEGMAKLSWILWSVLGGTTFLVLTKMLLFSASSGMKL